MNATGSIDGPQIRSDLIVARRSGNRCEYRVLVCQINQLMNSSARSDGDSNRGHCRGSMYINEVEMWTHLCRGTSAAIVSRDWNSLGDRSIPPRSTGLMAVNAPIAGTSACPMTGFAWTYAMMENCEIPAIGSVNSPWMSMVSMVFRSGGNDRDLSARTLRLVLTCLISPKRCRTSSLLLFLPGRVMETSNDGGCGPAASSRQMSKRNRPMSDHATCCGSTGIVQSRSCHPAGRQSKQKIFEIPNKKGLAHCQALDLIDIRFVV